MLRIDTSGNKEFRVLTQGRRVTEIKLRDAPAKVMFLSGKVSDVYKNDPIYQYLGEPISPTVVVIPTLVVTVDKSNYVFFGGGIDLQDAEATYHTLFDTYNQFQANNNKRKLPAGIPALKLPKVDLSSVPLQLPFGKSKSTTTTEESTEFTTVTQGLSANEGESFSLDDNNQQAT